MPTHTLKTDPGPFDAVARREKPYELRFDDRNYQVGDDLVLRRTEHTGEEMKNGAPLIYSDVEPEQRVIGHILRGPVYGLMPGWVILGFCESPRLWKTRP